MTAEAVVGPPRGHSVIAPKPKPTLVAATTAIRFAELRCELFMIVERLRGRKREANLISCDERRELLPVEYSRV